MPLYTFECESCGLRFDDSRSVDDRSPSSCRCGGKATRLISAPAQIISRGGDGEHVTRQVVDFRGALQRDLFGKRSSTQQKMQQYGEQLQEARTNVAAAKASGQKRAWKHKYRIPGDAFFHARHEHGKEVQGTAGMDFWQGQGFAVEE